MRIVCPSCDAVYEVPGALLGSPRPVRCARCGKEWLPETESALAAAPPVAAPASPLPAAAPPVSPQASLAERAAGRRIPAEAPQRPAVTAGPRAEPRVPVAPPAPSDPMLTVFPPLVGRPAARQSGRAAALAWAASLALLVLILLAAYVWRAELQAAWPPIQRAYAAIGLR